MSGDDSPWREWIDEHGAGMVLFARQWASTHADAEDIVQQAFVRFWPARRSARDPVAYLYACIRHGALQWIRERGRRQTRERRVARDATVGESLFESGIERDERRNAIEQALAALPIEQRQVVVLKIWEGMTFPRIGAALDISPNTASSRYRYALVTLREILSKETLA